MEERKIGDLIRERRKELNISQVKLAQLCEINHGTISRWENGQIKDIKRAQICLLSQYLYIPIDVLLGLSNETTTEDIEMVRLKSSITANINSMTDKAKLESIEKIIDALK